MPYGSSAIQNIIGDIYGGGAKTKGRAYTDIALGAAVPQFQAEQAELDKELKRELTRLM